jgi:Ca-activated chloride channel family protein
MAFSEAYILWFLPGIFVLAFIAYRAWHVRKKALERFSDLELYSFTAPAMVNRRWVIRRIFFLFALAMLILGLAGPRIGAEQRQVEKKVADIVVALDVSRSMEAKDVLPGRLEKAKMAISTLIKKLKGDRIGLVVFAGKAYIQLPLTTDYGAAELFLDGVNTDMVPVQGTDLVAAVEKSSECFLNAGSTGNNRAIIIITDGEQHEGDPLESVKAAKGEGITLFTVGIGDAKGTLLPEYEGGIIKGYKTDKSGNTVVSRLNEPLLMQMAEAGGGVYVQGNNTVAALDRVLKEINSMERSLAVEMLYTDEENRYAFFVFLGLLLLLLEYLIPEKKSMKKRKNRLFE